MSIEIKHIILYTSNKEELGSFLSQLFEIEPRPVRNGDIELCGNQFKFLLKDFSGEIESSVSNSIVLNFVLDSENELNDLRKKIEFINYRMSSSLIKKIGIVRPDNDDGELFFEFIDFDGRIWRFSVD